jgi:hypothetical protein
MSQDITFVVVGVLVVVVLALVSYILCNRHRNGKDSDKLDGSHYVQMTDTSNQKWMPFEENADKQVTEIRHLADNVKNPITMIKSEELTLGKIVGKGAEGVVRLGTWQGREVAVKVVDLAGLAGQEHVGSSFASYAQSQHLRLMIRMCVFPYLGPTTVKRG